ncbi:MAG: oxidoreductase [Myxococcota bacterium]
MPPWAASDIPDQSGRTAVVTGANSGIGYCAALELARSRAHVVLATRSPERGSEALQSIRAAVPHASVELASLDLADLDSVRSFVEALQHERIDLLVNNAGVMALPYRKTVQGFEMQLGTNHLGHFALTGLLLGRLAPDARIVNVASHAHRIGVMRWSDLQSERFYQRWLAYGQSKLANLLFTFEAARRLARAGSGVLSVACHPGFSSTHLLLKGAEMDGNPLKRWLWSVPNRLVAQSSEMGALPTLYAATHPEIVSGDYTGPRGPFEIWGHPRKVGSNRASRDEAAGQQLWEVSEALTGVRWLD